VNKVVIPSELRRCCGGAEVVEIEAANVRGLIEALDRRFPGFAEGLGTHFAVAIDGEIVQEAWLEPLPPGSEVCFLPALSGGS